MYEMMRAYFHDRRRNRLLQDRLQAGLTEDERAFLQAAEIGQLDIIKNKVWGTMLFNDAVTKMRSMTKNKRLQNIPHLQFLSQQRQTPHVSPGTRHKGHPAHAVRDTAHSIIPTPRATRITPHARLTYSYLPLPTVGFGLCFTFHIQCDTLCVCVCMLSSK
ncbi:hypothetical protein PoB_006096300 [Plakobranchus ocellatus]|uniref:Uncharacterized protein n=1 Tax=Plakobranchus ocellatus TaxID=259542 RepID=A0AAV4CRI4_9GAST|nr:hypothetical protein PoB_006096300 [Plakobranchus ocellatus]